MTVQESKIKNAFETTLAAQLTQGSGNTTMNLTDDPGITAPVYFVIDPDNDSKREVVEWTSGTYNNATVTRDKDTVNSGDGFTHDSGAVVRLAVVKQHFEDVHDRLEDIALTGDVTGTISASSQDIATTIAAGSVEFAMLDGAAVVVESETISSNDNDTTIPTSAAVKNYVDAETATLTNKTLGAVTLSGAVTGGDQEISTVILKDFKEDIATTSDSGTSFTSNTLTLDVQDGNVFDITLDGNITTWTINNMGSGTTISVILRQDATGSRTAPTQINSTTIKTVDGGGLTLSTGASDIDVVTVFYDGTDYLVFSQLNMS
jgi:hypothetical protein